MEEYNVCFIGDEKVGKTTLINLIVDNVFTKEYIPTIGINIRRYVTKKIINKRYYKIKLDLYEISGNNRFNCLYKIYIKTSTIIIFCLDTTNICSFEKIKNLFQEDLYSNKIIFLIGTKIDLKNERNVDINSIKQFTKLYNIHYMEINLPNKKNLKEFLFLLITQIYEYSKKTPKNIEK